MEEYFIDEEGNYRLCEWCGNELAVTAFQHWHKGNYSKEPICQSCLDFQMRNLTWEKPTKLPMDAGIWLLTDEMLYSTNSN